MPKTVLITGAGSGFGRGAAVELAQRGHKVIAAVLNDQQAKELARAEPKLTVAKIDITDAKDIAIAIGSCFFLADANPIWGSQNYGGGYEVFDAIAAKKPLSRPGSSRYSSSLEDRTATQSPSQANARRSEAYPRWNQPLQPVTPLRKTRICRPCTA